MCLVPQHHKCPKLDDTFEAIGLLTGGAENKWNQFKGVIIETAKTVLGPNEKLHQDWFDDNNEAVRAMLDEKRKAYTDQGSKFPPVRLLGTSRFSVGQPKTLSPLALWASRF